MGLVIRQSVYSTIISYAGVVIGYINLLYLYPKFLSLEQVGLLRTIQDAAILLTPFAQVGLSQSIIRFYPQLVKEKSDSHIFITLIMMLSVAGFAIFFILFKLFETPILSYFQENAKEIIEYSGWVLWLTLILVMTGLLEAYSRSLMKVIIPNLLREVVSRMLLGVLVLLYFSEMIDFNQFIISSVAAYLLCLLILITYLWRMGHISVQSDFKKLDKSKIPGMVQYSLLSFAGMAGMVLIGKVDSMMVSAMLNLAANAIYTTAFYMATVIEIPKRALSQIMMPLIAKAFDQNNVREVAKLYRKTSINQFIIGSLLLIGVYINLDNIFTLIPKGNQYELGKWVVIIVGVGKLVDMLFGPSSEIIVLSKYYKFNIILILLLAAIVIIANNLLIPIYGIEGAAWGSAFALITFNAIKFFFIYWKFKIQPFDFNTVKVLVISGVVFLINYIIPSLSNVFADILFRSGIITVVFAALILFSKTSEDASGLYDSLLARINKREKK
jgi:O-antigen/teichoic acid export membrane protein